MSEKKWTIGPWTVVKGYAIKSGEDYVCYGGCGCCNTADESIESEHDANLISAAPDLYEALEFILDELKGYNISSKMSSINQARAALAKARGAK